MRRSATLFVVRIDRGCPFKLNTPQDSRGIGSDQAVETDMGERQAGTETDTVETDTRDASSRSWRDCPVSWQPRFGRMSSGPLGHGVGPSHPLVHLVDDFS